jgi:hypothetical protein
MRSTRVTPVRIRCSCNSHWHARWNNTSGLSCSSARSSSQKPSAAELAGLASRNLRRSWISRRWSVRVCSRSPYSVSASLGTLSCRAGYATTLDGALLRSSGTKPRYGSALSRSAWPRRLWSPRRSPITLRAGRADPRLELLHRDPPPDDGVHQVAELVPRHVIRLHVAGRVGRAAGNGHLTTASCVPVGFPARPGKRTISR